jgi:adenosylmethionine-8-amino-7-oxononanoate aminotransferase
MTIDSSSVFYRGHDLLNAVSAVGAWITDDQGRSYLDAAGGAIATVLGHGDAAVIRALAEQAGRVDYVHSTAFTTEPIERYAAAVAGVVPVDDARVFPVSGGSEAMESALKIARAFHLAKGDLERDVVIARGASYHGNTRGALDVSGRSILRGPYQSWLGLTRRVPAVGEYRCPNPEHPDRCAEFHARSLDEEIERVGPDRVAAFVAEPVGGAASGVAMPPAGYWDRIVEVCHRHGVLLIADEVMTGFGRTGEWFASDHFGLRPDILVAAKGASSGYWPLGLAVCSGAVHDRIEDGGGLVHGFTWSHHPMGAAVGIAVMERLASLGLVDRARTLGAQLLDGLSSNLAEHPLVGDVRGIGMLACVELVGDRASKTPFPRSERSAERVTGEARELGLLVYPSTGNVDGVDGDYLLLGPPLTLLEEELDLIVDRLTASLGVLT